MLNSVQETKLDTSIPQICKTLEAIVQQLWKCSEVTTATSTIRLGSKHKPGGTMMMSHSEMTAKITRRYSDSMGRWAATSYACINAQTLTVLSCYQVCNKSNPNQGETTAYKQQQKILRLANKTQNPRFHFKKDLQKFVK